MGYSSSEGCLSFQFLGFDNLATGVRAQGSASCTLQGQWSAQCPMAHTTSWLHMPNALTSGVDPRLSTLSHTFPHISTHLPCPPHTVPARFPHPPTPPTGPGLTLPTRPPPGTEGFGNWWCTATAAARGFPHPAAHPLPTPSLYPPPPPRQAPRVLAIGDAAKTFPTHHSHLSTPAPHPSHTCQARRASATGGAPPPPPAAGPTCAT